MSRSPTTLVACAEREGNRATNRAGLEMESTGLCATARGLGSFDVPLHDLVLFVPAVPDLLSSLVERHQPSINAVFRHGPCVSRLFRLGRFRLLRLFRLLANLNYPRQTPCRSTECRQLFGTFGSEGAHDTTFGHR